MFVYKNDQKKLKQIADKFFTAALLLVTISHAAIAGEGLRVITSVPMEVPRDLSGGPQPAPINKECSAEQFQRYKKYIEKQQYLYVFIPAISFCGAKAVPVLNKFLDGVAGGKLNEDNPRLTLEALSWMGKESKEALPTIISKFNPIKGCAVRSYTQRVAEHSYDLFSGSYSPHHIILDILGSIGVEPRDASTIAESLIECQRRYFIDVQKLSPREQSFFHKSTGISAINTVLIKLNKAAVPTFIKALKSSDEARRIAAASSLVQVGGKAREAVPALIEALEDSHPFVRRYSALALGVIVAETSELKESEIQVIVSALFKKSMDESELVRDDAAQGLAFIAVSNTTSFPIFIKVLNDKDKSTHKYAAQVIKKIYELVGLTRLIEMLKISNDSTAIALGEEIRQEAINSISGLFLSLGKEDRASEIFFDGEDRVVETLVRIGRYAVPMLTEEFEKPNSSLNYKVAEALGKMGKDAKDAIPTLMKFIDYEDIDGCSKASSAVKVLGEIGENGRDIVPKLIAKLSPMKDFPLGKCSDLDGAIIVALGQFSADSKLAVPLLISSVHLGRNSDNSKIFAGIFADVEIFSDAEVSLKNIGAQAIPDLIVALNDRNLVIRQNAAYMLAVIKVPAKEAIQPLQEIVDNKQNSLKLRRLAAYALEKNGINMDGFFAANKIIPPDKVGCLRGNHYGPGYLYAYDPYTGECTGEGTGQGDAFSLFDKIRQLFKKDKK